MTSRMPMTAETDQAHASRGELVTAEPVTTVARATHGGGFQVIRTAHRHGLNEGTRAFLERHRMSGGCGVDADGVWRSWECRGSTITLHVGSFAAAPVTIRPADVVAWTLARFTDADHARLDELAARWSAALRRVGRDLDQKRWIRPSTLTDDERAHIDQAGHDRFAAERAMAVLIDGCLARDKPAPRPGEQLNLFALT